MRAIQLGLVLALLCSVVPVGAQTEALNPTLQIGEPAVAGGGRIAIAPEQSMVEVAYTYVIPAPGSADPDGTTITWDLDCGGAGLAIMSPVDTVIAFEAGKTDYSGIEALAVSATPDTPGLQELPCTVTGTAAATTAFSQATNTVNFLPNVEYRGEIVMTSEETSKMAGPQKAIYYIVDVTNRGNARTVVDFDVIGNRSGRWTAVVPTPVVVDVDMTVSVSFVVSTPFENGNNKGQWHVTLVGTPSSSEDPTEMGTPQELEFTSKVDGVYVPGPSPAVLLIAMAFVAMIARRRS